MAGERELNRDATLPPDTYMYLQNTGKGGVVNVYRGPCVVSQTGQDEPIIYDPANKSYKKVGALEQAVRLSPRANESDYVVLENPAGDATFPADTSGGQQAKSLKKGHKIVVPGPWSEALWPGQIATVIEGHRLRSNQYLVAIVYNADEAAKNWTAGTIAEKTDAEKTNADPEKTSAQTGIPKPSSFAVGTRIVIKGADVSFYIPCTGVEVLKDENGKYVREAVTLEQLEYCCLIDENGKKKYPKGPKVVFPEPTQVFETDKRGRRKFKPIELNTINGIHLKVTADFKGPDIENDLDVEREFKEGEELFVTGKTLSIYYPIEELAIIEYGQGNKKHYSTSIPKGEGRYVMHRETGSIDLLRGPKMYLADPRREIPIRRVLSLDECGLWYPNNKEALAYNQDLADAMAESPSGRSGVVSEGDYRKRQLKRGLTSFDSGSMASLSAMPIASSEYSPEEAGEEGETSESIVRKTSYSQPRTLTLNTKYGGVPRVEVWPGYAVLVVGAEGSRRVVEGPQVVLLAYDEKLGHMDLSTGKPKSTDTLFRTAYLCVQNNQVGDIVSFESKDHVRGEIKISLRVNFEAKLAEERLKWFGVDNYVKFLTDHVRSIIAGTAKKLNIAEIKADYVNIVRDAILGQKTTDGVERPGLSFSANGMRVAEVEVLAITLKDEQISKLLDQAQHKVVQTNIEIEQAQKDLEAAKRKEEISQERLGAEYATKRLATELQTQSIADQMELLAAQFKVELEKLLNEQKKQETTIATQDLVASANLARAKEEAQHQISIDRAKLELKNNELSAATESAVKRFEAAKAGLFEVLTSLSRDELAAKLAEACTIERFLSGDNVTSSIANLLSVAPALKTFFDKATDAQKNGNRLKAPETTPSR